MYVSSALSSVQLPAARTGTSISRVSAEQPAAANRSRPAATVERLAAYPERSRGGLLIYSLTASSVSTSTGMRVDVRV